MPVKSLSAVTSTSTLTTSPEKSELSATSKVNTPASLPRAHSTADVAVTSPLSGPCVTAGPPSWASAGLIGPNLARQIVTTWLNTEFGGGRHARRVDKIDAIGKRYSLKQ
ncbi:MAG TPA: hypothetical protein EYP41_13640 [Anaerolineae bacterium]|nr:hypothetical protein [Anaerolineae bacterium]